MERLEYLDEIERRFATFPIVALLGPRQVGKTTIARAFLARTGAAFERSPNVFDLEDPLHLARLQTPKLALESLRGLVVIDEIQRAPELFPLLRVLADREGAPARFLILGSASPDLLRQTSESLAGRVTFIEIDPFSICETGQAHADDLWLRGGFPRSYLAATDADSALWRSSYIRTYLERDIPLLGIQIPPPQIRRFWMMLSHFHGNIFNASEIGRSLGVADTTVRRYLDILCSTFMVRALPPWFENINRRQVKSPKIYFRDSGILHSLLGITEKDQLLLHPRLGASWEGFALEEVIRCLAAEPSEVFFWGVHQQAELDLLIVQNGKRRGFEIKYSDTPALTRSMSTAMELLHLDELTVLIPGEGTWPLAPGVTVCGLRELPSHFASQPSRP